MFLFMLKRKLCPIKCAVIVNRNSWIVQKNLDDLGQIFLLDHNQNFISQQISEIMVHMPAKL